MHQSFPQTLLSKGVLLTFRGTEPIPRVVKYKKQLFLQIALTNFKDNQEVKITEGKKSMAIFLKLSKQAVNC